MRRPRITAKQEGGNDGYCYVVRVDGRVFVDGLTRREVPYYKQQALKRWEERNAQSTTSQEPGGAAPAGQ